MKRGNELYRSIVSSFIIYISSPVRRRWPSGRFGLHVLYAAVLFAVAWLSHFAMLSNDVFPLRWQAEHLSLRHPETFYDGFFPIGYPLLLRVASLTGNPVLALMLLQIGLAAVYVLLARRLFQTVLDKAASLIALPIVLFTPQIAGNVLSVTPDFAAALCALTAFFFIARASLGSSGSTMQDTRRNIFLAGISMGVGYLFRTHILILALTVALGLLIFENGRRMRVAVWFCIGAVPFVIAQGVLQVWTGHGFFENAQAFNIWRMMYGMDWNNPAALGGMSVFDVVRNNPTVFLAAYWGALMQGSLYILPCLIALLFLFMRGRTATHRVLTVLTFATLLYLVITVIGGSPRNVAPVIPMLVADGLFVIGLAFGRVSAARKQSIAQSFATLVWAGGIIGIFFFSYRSAPRVRDYAEVERLLNVHSRADALSIYTDDFDFYFPDLRYQTPRESGGWPEAGLPHYIEEFPHIRDSSARILHDDLIKNGIRWAIFRIPPYDGRGYESIRGDTTLFRLMYRTPRHEIYRVE